MDIRSVGDPHRRLVGVVESDGLSRPFLVDSRRETARNGHLTLSRSQSLRP